MRVFFRFNHVWYDLLCYFKDVAHARLQFDNIFTLEGVPVITVQLRYDGWVTELKDQGLVNRTGEGRGYGLNNLLYR